MTFYQSGSAAGSEDPLLQALRWRTMYESASAATPRNRLIRAVRRNGDLLSNSGSLMATSILTSVVGFGYWWLAARLYPPEAVGSVSAAVAAMTLVGTLGMFGMGTLLISELPRMGDRQWRLITTCVLVAATVAGFGGLLYEVIAYLSNAGLREALGSPFAALLLLVGMAANAAALVLDEGLVGLLKGRLQLVRNAYFAVGKLVLLAVLAVLPIAVTGTWILGTWVAGIFLSTVLLAFSLRGHGLGGGSVRPDLTLLQGLRRNALDHNLFNLALFLPRTMLPLVVTAVLSTRATASFYTAWMVLSFLAMIPGNVATTLFAVTSAGRAALRGKMRMALLVSLGVGMPASLLVAILARPIMSTFGHGYAAAASNALAILALTFVATVIRQLYVAVSRVLNRVRRASLVALGAGVVEVGAAWYGASQGGLTSLALFLAAAFLAEGAVMAPTVLKAALARPATTAGAEQPTINASTPPSGPPSTSPVPPSTLSTSYHDNAPTVLLRRDDILSGPLDRS